VEDRLTACFLLATGPILPMKRPILILCIDRDNDLYEKAKVPGPVVGREQNVKAALQLALADPEDPDSNAIFYAVKVYDKMKKEGQSVEVVTLSGHKELGYAADRAVSIQLDRVIRELHPESCILISDGASDEEIFPVIKSRLPIDSTKIIFIKQAKELEKTYFVVLEKLKDPHYARLVLGLPALFILLISISTYMGWGWQPAGVVLGIYLILKGFGFDSFVYGILRDFRFSIEKTSWVSYIGGFALMLITLLIVYQSYLTAFSLGLSAEKTIAYIVRNAVVVALVAFLLIIAGKSIDGLMEKRKFILTRYALYSIAAVLTALVLRVGSNWVLNLFSPYVAFSDFLLTLVAAIILGYASIRLIKEMRTDLLIKMKLTGKEVLNEHGSYLGKIVGINGRDGSIILRTMVDKKYVIPFSSVVALGDSIVVKAEG